MILQIKPHNFVFSLHWQRKRENANMLRLLFNSFYRCQHFKYFFSIWKSVEFFRLWSLLSTIDRAAEQYSEWALQHCIPTPCTYSRAIHWFRFYLQWHRCHIDADKPCMRLWPVCSSRFESPAPTAPGNQFFRLRWKTGWIARRFM